MDEQTYYAFDMGSLIVIPSNTPNPQQWRLGIRVATAPQTIWLDKSTIKALIRRLKIEIGESR